MMLFDPIKARMREIVKWTGNVGLITSATIISFSPILANQWYAFVGYVIGSILWMYIGFKTKDNALTFINVVFLIINIYGLYIRYK